MIIHYNCTRQFLVALVFGDLPSLSPFIFILVYIRHDTNKMAQLTIFIGGKSYAYQVYRKRVSEDLAVFSASLNHPMYFQVNTQLIDCLTNNNRAYMCLQKLKRNIHEVFRDADLYPTSVEPISIEGDGVLLKWPSKTLWTITPDKIPCKVGHRINLHHFKAFIINRYSKRL